jgi:hypothetical protein
MAMNHRTLRPSASGFTPRSISGLALWLDASSADTLYTTDAGPVTAVTQPTDIAGCVGWWDASDAASITQSGGLVSQWNDKSTAGNHATASSTARPTTGTRSLNGKNVLDFDGTANAMATSLADAATQTVLFVAVSDVASGGRVWSYGTTNRGVFSDSGTWAFWRQQTSGPISFGATASATSPSVACALFTSNSSLTTFGNGAQGTTNDPVDSSGATFNIGKESTSFHNGYIAEIVIYNTALTTADRARVEAYLATKWGISGVHAQATASSDPVGYWADKSGNARHATQGTAGSRPTRSVAINTRSAVLLANGAVQRLTANGVYMDALGDNTNKRITILATLQSSGQSQQKSIGEVDQGSGFGCYHNISNIAYFDAGAGVPASRAQGALASSVITGGAVFIGRRDGGAVDQWYNGALIAGSLTSATGSLRTAGDNPFSVKAVNSGSLAYGEVLVYNRALTSAERQRAERYLASRWGITLAPQVSNADAQDWINRVYANGGQVSASTAAAVNTLCDSLDASGVRPLIYRMGIFCGSNLNAALVPLYRGPSLGGTQYGNTTDTNVGGLFVSGDYNETGASGGLKGNGTTKHLDTGFAQSTVPLSNLHLSASFLQMDTSGTADLMGVRSSQTSAGMYSAGVSVGTSATNVGSPSTSALSYFVFARNNGGTADTRTSVRIRMYSIGQAIDAAGASAFANAVAAFNTAMGRT